MKKILPLLIISALLLVSLSACSGKKFKSNDSSTVLTVGDREISSDMYRYFYLTYKNSNGYDLNEQELKEKTEEGLREIAAALDIAAEYKMSLPEDDRKEIEDGIATMKDSYDTEDEFYAFLESGYLSEQAYFDIQYYLALEEWLYSYMTDESTLIIKVSDDVLDEALESNVFMAAINIIIPYEKAETSTPAKATGTEEELTGRALADSLYERIKNGEDIEKLADEYSYDTYSSARYFAPNTMQTFFEDKVKSLDIGEVSEVYEAETGYYITKRVAIDKEYVSENYEDLRDEYIYSQFLGIVLAKANAYTLTYAENFDPAIAYKGQ